MTTKKQWIIAGIIVLGLLGMLGTMIYERYFAKTVYIDTATIQAPEIPLAPSQQGVLEEIYVQPGDMVLRGATVARVGTELITAQTDGLIVDTNSQIGTMVSANAAVVTMIDPTALRVVGLIDEDKGLNRVAVGDPVVFTVDAFGSTKFSGVVDEVAPTSNESGIVFNISDKRETKQFAIKARFDISRYPQLHNGMSARMWISAQ